MQPVNIAEPQLLYMDAQFIVVSKPHNLNCAPQDTQPDCLLSRMQTLFETAQIVHEVAFECSGATVLALSDHAKQALSQQAEDGRFSVHYQALTESASQAVHLQQPAADLAPETLDGQPVARAVDMHDNHEIGRLLLHISKVELKHPTTGLSMTFEAPCPF